MEKNRRRLILLSILMAVVWLALLAIHTRLSLQLVAIKKEWSPDITTGFIVAFVMLLILVWCFVTIIIIVRHQRKTVEFREKMAHSIIHELKTPITTINLTCQLLQDQSIAKDPQSTEMYVSMIANESKSLQNLVEEVLSVFQTNVILRKELVDVHMHELVQSVLDVHQLAINECGAEVVLDFQANQDVVLGDSTHLGNAISNLIDNAIKYRDGNLVLNISTSNVNNTIEIRIADNGIGIDPKDHKLIFEPFARINTDNAHYTKGYGLGLSYVGFVADYHHGTIKVDSEIGKGATFVLSLPLK